MKSSSARQFRLNFEPSGTIGDRRNALSSAPVALDDSSAEETPNLGSWSSPLNESRPVYPDSAFAVTARLAGRINAASVSQEEHTQLLKEREQLLDKKFASGLTPKEANRLKYVRWSLDRIDDARSGVVLDMLENAVVRYEKFQSDIQSLLRQLEDLKKPAK